MSQLELLRNIGTSEMEKEFEGRVKHLAKVHKISEIAERSYRAQQLEEENVKKILQDVLNEVHLKNMEGKGRQLDT